MLAGTMCRVEVHAEGDPVEMGLAQGVSLRDKIQSASSVLAQLYGFRILQPAWLPYALYRRVSERRARRFLEGPLQRDFPEAHRRMMGISAGSATDMGLLHLLHALEPMLSDVSRCAVVPAFGACSAVAVRGRRSATGEPVIARNFDYLPLVQPLYSGGGILMLADATRDIASLELSNTRSRIRRPSAGADVLFHTNAFFNHEMRSVEMPAEARYTDRAPVPLRGRRVHESSNVRDRRFQQLLKNDTPLDIDTLAALMSDHETAGNPGDTSICKHSDYWNTTATLQLFPISRRMRVAFDSACRAQYTDIVL